MNRNTALISAASVVAVVVAGVTAIGANIGILSSADGGPVGNLNAAGLIDNPIEPQVIDIYVDGATTTGSAIADLPPAVVGELIGSGKVAASQEVAATQEGAASQEVAATQEGAVDQEVAVAEAGTVVIRSVAGTVIVGGVQVTFTSASKSLIFVASVDDTGKLSMRVDEPIVEVVTVPAAPLAPEVSTQAHDDDYEDDDHEDDDYEDDDHEDDDHEDDDHEDDDEHEGRDDDD